MAGLVNDDVEEKLIRDLCQGEFRVEGIKHCVEYRRDDGEGESDATYSLPELFLSQLRKGNVTENGGANTAVIG